jgi:curved DNA-binding protein CbpA
VAQEDEQGTIVGEVEGHGSKKCGMDYQECCAILDLVPPVTLDDAKQAYKDLVQVWHPDRFTHSPRLQERAESKLKQLNLAYETLTPLLQRQQEIRIRETARKAQPEQSNSYQTDPSVWNVASTYHDAMGTKRWLDRLSLRAKARIYGILFLPAVIGLVILILGLATFLSAYPQILIIGTGSGAFYYLLRKLSEHSSRS